MGCVKVSFDSGIKKRRCLFLFFVFLRAYSWLDFCLLAERHYMVLCVKRGHCW